MLKSSTGHGHDSKKIPEGVETPGGRARVGGNQVRGGHGYCNSFHAGGQRFRTTYFLEKQGLDFTVEFL